jgi:hypothetical protein
MRRFNGPKDNTPCPHQLESVSECVNRVLRIAELSNPAFGQSNPMSGPSDLMSEPGDLASEAGDLMYGLSDLMITSCHLWVTIAR